MSTTYELHPFHEDPAVAGALGRLFVRREAPDPDAFDAVADRFGVDPARLEAAVYRLGVESETDDLPGRVSGEAVAHRTAPEWLAGRGPVVRKRDGVRDPELRRRVDATYDLPFESWLLVEAAKAGRVRVRERLEDVLGEDAETLSVQTRAELGTAPFPERMLFVGVAYPVDATEPDGVPAVVSPPPFPFEAVGTALPSTIDVRVASGGETFVVRSLPVVPFEECRSH